MAGEKTSPEGTVHAIHWAYLVVLVVIFAASFYLFYPRVESFFIYFPNPVLTSVPRSFVFNTRKPSSTPRTANVCTGGSSRVRRRTRSSFIFMETRETSPTGSISFSLFCIGDFRSSFSTTGIRQELGKAFRNRLYKDGLAAWAYLVEKEKITPERIVLHGHSIGAAVAIEVALQKR